jgi:hypothetical protein
MIICNSRGYIFIHLHKTGGTSVEAALEPTLNWNDILLGSTPFGEACNLHYRHRFGLTKHSSLEEVCRLCASCPQIQTYRVVSVVREPLERAVSLFNFIAAVVERISNHLELKQDQLSQRRAELVTYHPQLDWPAVRAFLEARMNFEAFIASPTLQLEARSFQSQVSQLCHEGTLPADLCWLTTNQLNQAGGLLTELAGTIVTVKHLNASPQCLIRCDEVNPSSHRLIRQRFAVDDAAFGFSA